MKDFQLGKAIELTTNIVLNSIEGPLDSYFPEDDLYSAEAKLKFFSIKLVGCMEQQNININDPLEIQLFVIETIMQVNLADI